jgi:hypothetical protein
MQLKTWKKRSRSYIWPGRWWQIHMEKTQATDGEDSYLRDPGALRYMVSALGLFSPVEDAGIAARRLRHTAAIPDDDHESVDVKRLNEYGEVTRFRVVRLRPSVLSLGVGPRPNRVTRTTGHFIALW